MSDRSPEPADEREWRKAEAFNTFAMRSDVHGHDTERVFGAGFDAAMAAADERAEELIRWANLALARVTEDRNHATEALRGWALGEWDWSPGDPLPDQEFMPYEQAIFDALAALPVPVAESDGRTDA